MTVVASEVLEAYLRTTKSRVIQEIERVRKQGPHPSEIREEEIREAIERLRVADVRQHYVRLLKQTGSFLVIVVVPLIVIGLTIVSLVNKFDGSDRTDFWSAILSGVAGALFSIALTAAYRLRMKMSEMKATLHRVKSSEFLRRFSQLEGEARGLASRLRQEQDSEGALGTVLSTLEDYGVWSREDVNLFRDLLRLRNSLVHEEKSILRTADTDFAAAQIERLRDLIASQDLRMASDRIPRDQDERLGPDKAKH